MAFPGTDDYLPSSPALSARSTQAARRLVRGVQVHGVQTVAFIMCSSAEIISDINHAITSTQHRPGTSRHSARITQILSENMLREALKIRYLKLFTLRVR